MAKRRGPPPKPAHLKLITANPGRRKIPEDMPEPDLLTHATPPEYLSDVAKQKWPGMVEMLSRNGVFTEMDVDLLALYCEAYADRLDCRSQMSEGKTHTADSGYQSISPYAAMERQCIKVMMDIMNAFGMGPAYRTRIQIDAQANNAKKTGKGGLLD